MFRLKMTDRTADIALRYMMACTFGVIAETFDMKPSDNSMNIGYKNLNPATNRVNLTGFSGTKELRTKHYDLF